MILTSKITEDIDDGRINNYPRVVIDSSGRQVIFYDKYLTTGKNTYSRVTYTPSSFTISVESGSGTINGTPVSWLAGTLTATQNKYEVVSVDSTGMLSISDDVSMTALQDVVILAFVSSGNSSVTYVEELERTGHYIFSRRQILSGSDWVWDDIEFRLNTGEQPQAFYDSSSGNIYMTYKKDSSSYVRVLDPSDELTWEYKPNVIVNVFGEISMNRAPQNSVEFGVSSGYTTSVNIYNSNINPMGATGFYFLGNQIYVYVPQLSGSYLLYITSPITYEIGTYTGGIFTVEGTYVISSNSVSAYERFRLWTGTIGVKHLRVRYTSTLFTGEFVTSPEYYLQFEIYAKPAKVALTDNYSVDTRDDVTLLGVSAGHIAVVAVVNEYQETRDFESDSRAIGCVSVGYAAVITQINEYVETRDFESDSRAIGCISAGYAAVVTFTNL